MAGTNATTASTERQPARLSELAPGLTAAFVREALHRAIHGVGPLPPAAAAAEAQLREQHGNVERAIHEVIENHVRYAGAQGFVTNLGGLVTDDGDGAGQHHRAGAGPVPDDRRHRPPARLRPRRPAGAATRCWPACSARRRSRHGWADRSMPGAADGDGHGSRSRPGPRPGRLGRGRRRPGRQGRRQARGGHQAGRRVPLVGGFVGRVPTATPPGRSAATPTASSCLAPAGRPSSRRGPSCSPPAGVRPSAGTGRSVAGRPAPATGRRRRARWPAARPRVWSRALSRSSALIASTAAAAT